MEAAISKIAELGGKLFDPATITTAQRSELMRVLSSAFGSPSMPLIQGDEETAALADALGIQRQQLAEGSRLYRRHCLQCHGISGDARGPTGPWIYPHPRDFRQGMFKWVTTGAESGGRPRRSDLVRTIRKGIDGTSMPSFSLLPDAELERLADYVIHLSLRGEVEYRLLVSLMNDGDEVSLANEAPSLLKNALRQWNRAALTGGPASQPTLEGDEEHMTADRQQSIARGYQLFMESQAAGCASCHEDFGRQAKSRYDVWGTQVRPANLTEKNHRGGNSAFDLYWRVRGGIHPSGMPAPTALNDEQIWDLVHFVQALPYPNMLPQEVCEKVYPAKQNRRRTGER